MEFVSLERTREITVMRKTSMYEAIKRGLFPKPIQVNGRVKALPRHEIEAVMKARLAGKNDSEIRALVESLHSARENLV